MNKREIIIDGESYIKKDVFDDLEKEYKELKTKKEPSNALKEFQVVELDHHNIMGIGAGEVGDNWVAVKVSINYLEQALKIIKTLKFEEKKSSSSVTLAWANNQPLIIGSFKEDVTKESAKKQWSGVILAPRVDASD